MATLQQAIDQIQDAVGAVSGIRGAPDEPPDKITVWPFVICYASDGEYNIGPPELMTGVHTLALELHVARKDLPRDVQKAMTYAKSVPDSIYSALVAGSLTAIATLGTIRYSFGVMEYAGQKTVGFMFSVDGVKTQDTIT